ncbi:tyrosine-protein phosphatase [Streptacidiphilus sp. N1-10]|uniref:Tyrosine-protein phosphatase n=1 Tax=Streptacidiphilus jeojiensis TaxID=3229225 RepID=A0ABV6XQX6_9ACTN
MTGRSADAARWVELAEVDNVRDLGGLPVRGGGATRRGVLFRASTVQEATPADVEVLLDGLGLRTLVDLRGPRESAREGHGLLERTGLSRVNLPVRQERGVAADAVPDVSGSRLADFYLAMLAGSGPSVLAAARIVADRERHAVLFHCAVGKDRTGLLAAVLLDAVGVPADAIAEDYALSASRTARIGERLARLPSYGRLPAVEHGLMSADPAVMHRFLETLRTGSGGGAGWLLRQGLTEAELQDLRAALVEP